MNGRTSCMQHAVCTVCWCCFCMNAWGPLGRRPGWLAVIALHACNSCCKIIAALACLLACHRPPNAYMEWRQRQARASYLNHMRCCRSRAQLSCMREQTVRTSLLGCTRLQELKESQREFCTLITQRASSSRPERLLNYFNS